MMMRNVSLFSLHFSISLSFSLSIYIYISLSLYIYIYIYTSLSIYLSISLSISPSLSVSLFIPLYLSLYLSLSPPSSLHICGTMSPQPQLTIVIGLHHNTPIIPIPTKHKNLITLYSSLSLSFSISN